MGQSDSGAIVAMDICATLENDQATNKAVAGIVKKVVDTSKHWPDEHQTDAHRDKQIGGLIRAWLGERLDIPSAAKPQRLPHDCPVNLVWMTYISRTDWPVVGRYFRERWQGED